MLDIIGDVHGHAYPLTQLLQKLGYQEKSNNTFFHPNPLRKICFLGDLIDRGPDILKTLTIVKNIVDNHQGYCILGNHEYNYLAFLTPKSPAPTQKNDDHAQYCRTHNQRHKKEIQNTQIALNQLPDKGNLFINWLFSLPLYLEIQNVRLIHAAWHQDAIQTLKLSENLLPKYVNPQNENVIVGPRLTQKFIRQATTGKFKKAIDLILKGPEINLGKMFAFRDNDNNLRNHARLRWWLNKEKSYDSIQDITLISNPEKYKTIDFSKIPARHFNLDALTTQGYPTNLPPVFFGHYWMQGTPAPINENLCCLDYSIANKSNPGKLVAYSYNGEKILKKNHLTWTPNPP